MLLKEFADVDAFPICLDTKDPDEIVADREGDRARLRRHQPRGHLLPALLRDRGAPQGGARHPRLPRRPARHRGRRDGGAVQRAEGDRQAARGPARRDGRARRGRHRGHAGCCCRSASPTSSAATRKGAIYVGRDDWDEMHPLKRWYAENTNRDRRTAARPTCSRAPTSSSASPGPGVIEAPSLDRMNDGRDGVRDGEPGAGGDARGGRRPRAHHRHRPLRLPEPDQQRALLPGHLPRRARRRARPRSPRR